MEYDLEESRICTAFEKKDVEDLRRLLDSNYMRIKSLGACKLYVLDGCNVVIVIDRIKDFKMDEALAEVVDYAMERNRFSEVYKLIDPALWQDFVVFLEQFCRVLRVAAFLKCMKIDCLRVLRIAKKTVKEEDRRMITEYLLLYCEFKINRRPEEQRKLALSAVVARPLIPYPDEHSELLRYLASVGVDINKYGYDPEMHGDILVTMPEHEQAVELIEKNSPLQEILAINAGLVELLHMGYTIDFATNTYTK